MKCSFAAERLLRCRPMFSMSLMVSVAVSKLGCSPLFFVEPGVKVDGRYYRTCYWNSRCCQSCTVLLVTRTCSSGITPQLTALATLSSYYSRRLQSSLHSTCGRQTAQTWTRWTTVSGVSCRTSLQDCNAWHSSPQAAPHWDLVQHSTDCEAIDEWATTTSQR